MQVDIIKIGNSRGVRIPAAILKQCGIEAQVELEVRDNEIVLKAVHDSRAGWAEAFQLMHQNGDDLPIIDEGIDNDLLEEWDDN